MSEFINNTEAKTRTSELLEFVKRVQGGADLEEIRTEYATAIDAVTPYDVLVIEDTMLREGASISDIKAHIEPILGTFREALVSHEWDEPDRGHPLDNMMRENRAIESHVSEIQRLADEIANAESPPLSAVGELQTHVEAMADIEVHYVRKENELFPYLEDHWKHDRPLGVMWSLHDDIRETRSEIETLLADPATDPKQLSELVDRLAKLIRGMIFKEEKIIFPVAASTLTDEEWTEIQQESPEIGYFEIEPAFEFVEPDAGDTEGDTAGRLSPRDEDGAVGGLSPGSVALGLGSGTLTGQKIEVLLDTLPVDVTYVDENDRVRYFNNPEDRIFPRSRSIIGRTVQNCHPPESVDKVEEILTAFRSGDRDKARFWIQNDSDFIVIEYYALRDTDGSYRGTLEVTQETSDIRALEGEKRLVEWGSE